MKRAVAISFAACAFLGVAACGSSKPKSVPIPAPTDMRGRKQVEIDAKLNQFTPAAVIVDVGTSVTWRNTDTVAHHVEKSADAIDTAIRQLVSKAVTSDRVIDIFADSGLKSPAIPILPDEFPAEYRHQPHKNTPLDLPRTLLNAYPKSLPHHPLSMSAARSVCLGPFALVASHLDASDETSRFLDLGGGWLRL